MKPFSKVIRAVTDSIICLVVVFAFLFALIWLSSSFFPQFFSNRPEILRMALSVFGGAAWTFMVLHIQEHFFMPKDLTGEQLQRLGKAKGWITLIGAIGGLVFFGLK